MAHFRGKRALKVEFMVTIIILISAVMFSVESKEFFVENVLEQNYEELTVYKDVFDTLESSWLSDSSLENAISDLESINNDEFVLQNDVKLGIAYAYEELGDYDEAETILLDIIENGNDSISVSDGVFQLGEMYENQDQIDDSIALFEQYYKIFGDYRKNELDFKLADLYYQSGDFQSSGVYMIEVVSVDSADEDLYSLVIESNWANYTMKQKESVLDRLAAMDMNRDFADYSLLYIEEYNPDSWKVEELALNLVYNSQSSYVFTFIESIGEYEEYNSVYLEMTALYNMSGNSIDSGSGAVRGLYYYRKLKDLSGLYSYDADDALSYYEGYLDGDMDFEYTDYNLTLAIRNLLAYQDYASITNIVEASYVKHDLNPEIGSIAQNISFWNGYAHYMLDNNDRALEELQNAISVCPDGYFAVNAKEIILDILDEMNLSEQEYLSTLDYNYISNPEVFIKLHYAKVLYVFREGYGKEMLRQKIVEMFSRFNDDYLFEFDENQINRLKVSDNYVRFIIYTRYGFLEKAKAILSSSGIDDEQTQNLLILSELVKNKEFSRARDLNVDYSSETFVNNNFAFLSDEIQQLILPRPYDTEIEMALTKLTTPLVDEYLVYGIIRQESMYISDAKSWAGAKGLMQLMPATAAWVAEKVWGTSDVDTYNTVNNIMLGTRYINDNVSAYGFMTAVAAYNSGYTILRKTDNRFDPASEYELLEILPYKETRNYVKKVLTNYYRYKALYDDEEVVAIEEIILDKGDV